MKSKQKAKTDIWVGTRTDGKVIMRIDFINKTISTIELSPEQADAISNGLQSAAKIVREETAKEKS